jgi:4-hydroxybenzoate polyprenyltransferase
MKRKESNPFDYFFLIRPTLLIPVWTFLLLGYYWGKRCSEFGVGSGEWGVRSFEFQLPASEFLWVFLLYSALMSGVYILNQITDRETDRINKKLFLLSENIIPVKFALIEMAILFLFAIAFSIIFFQLSLFTLFVFLSLIMGIFYSVPPFKFKGKPVFDLLWNSLGFGFLNFSVGWLATARFSPGMVYHSLPYVLSVGGVFLTTTIPDISGDEDSGDRTTGVFLGKRKTGLLSSLFLFLALVSSFIVRDPVCFIASSIALPLFLFAVLKDGVRFYLISIRIGAPLLVILTAFLFPYYILLLVITFASLKIYYKNRFSLSYPSLFTER